MELHPGSRGASHDGPESLGLSIVDPAVSPDDSMEVDEGADDGDRPENKRTKSTAAFTGTGSDTTLPKGRADLPLVKLAPATTADQKLTCFQIRVAAIKKSKDLARGLIGF